MCNLCRKRITLIGIMKKNKIVCNYALLGIASFVLLGCHANEVQNYIADTVLAIPFSENSVDRRLNMSELTDSVEYIPIETNPALYPISHATCVKYIADKLYIQDVAQRLHIVNRQGKIIGQLSAIGKAKDEYISLGRFDVNPASGQISIYDNASRKMNIYSPQCDFIRSIRLDNNGLIDDFAVLPNGDHLMYLETFHSDDVRRGLWRIDSLGQFKNQYFDISNDFKYSSGLFPNMFQHINDTVISLKGHQDKNFIYHITQDTIKAAYKFEYDIPFADEIKNIRYANDEMRRKYAGKYYDKTDCMENNKWLLLTTTNGQKNVVLLYNKLTQEKIVFNSEDIKDVIVNDVGFPVKLTTFGNNIFVGLFYSETFESINNLKERFPHLSLNSNPVFALYY